MPRWLLGEEREPAAAGNAVLCRRAAAAGGSSDATGCGRAFGGATAEAAAENRSPATRWVPSPHDEEAGGEWGEAGSAETINEPGFHAAEQLEPPPAKKPPNPAATDATLPKRGRMCAGDVP